MNLSKKTIALSIALLTGAATVTGLLWIVIESSDVVKQTVSLTRKQPANESERKNDLEKLKKIDQNSIEAVSQLAGIAFSNKEFNKAAQQYYELYMLNPSDKEALFKSARSTYLAGDLAKASSLFNQEELDQFPDTATYRARFLLGEQKLIEAENTLQRNLQNYPDHTPSRLLLAETYLMANKAMEAQKIFESLLDATNKLEAAAAHFGIAQVIQREGKSEAAIAWMKKAPETQVSMQLDTAKAELWRNLGQPDESIKLYERLLDHYGPQVELIVAYAELLAAKEKATLIEFQRDRIKSATAYSLAARHYLDALVSYLAKDYPKTLQSLRWAEPMLGSRELFSLVEMDTSAIVGDKARFASSVERINISSLSENRSQYLQNLLLKHASERLNRGDGQFGQLLSETVLKLDSENDAAQLMLARAYLLLGKNKETITLAEQLLTAGKFADAVLELSSRAHIEMGNYDKARESLNRLQALDTNKPVSYYWFGINEFRQKHYDQAIVPLKKAFSLGAEIKSGAALVDVYISQKHFDAAIEIAEAFKAKNEKNTQALGWAFLGGVELAKENPAASAQHYEQAALLDPARTIYKLSALDRYIDAKDYDNAFRILAGLKKVDNYGKVVRFKEAYLQQISGQSDKAIKSYRQLQYDYPDWAIVHLNLSELLAEKPETVNEALQMARKASELAPNWSAAHMNLARMLAANDKPDDALVFARKALSIDKNLIEAKALINKLDKKT